MKPSLQDDMRALSIGGKPVRLADYWPFLFGGVCLGAIVALLMIVFTRDKAYATQAAIDCRAAGGFPVFNGPQETKMERCER